MLDLDCRMLSCVATSTSDLRTSNVVLEFRDVLVDRFRLVLVPMSVLPCSHFLLEPSSRPETRPEEPLSSSTDSLSHDCSYFCFCM